MNDDWRKSSYSNPSGNCVEVRRAPWRKSSYSQGQANCVETRPGGHGVEVRDSKDPNGPVLSVSVTAWQAFVRSL